MAAFLYAQKLTAIMIVHYIHKAVKPSIVETIDIPDIIFIYIPCISDAGRENTSKS